MSNLIPLEDAARLLGLTVEKMNEMRSNSEIFGYKDGTSWKFKMQELERIADELDITIDVGSSAVSESADVEELDESEFEISLDEDDELSFDLSESSADLLQDDDAAPLAGGIDADSGELRLEGDDSVPGKPAGKASESDDEPADDDTGELSFGASDIHLASGDDAGSADLLDDQEPRKGDPSTGKLLHGDDDDEMLLSEEDLFEDELTIQDSYEENLDLSSDFENSSDLIMDDSDSSSEVKAARSDSGSGASAAGLDESDSSEINLSESGVIELSDDDDMIVVDEPGDPDDPTQLQDDDFNLTALEEVDDEESSGSQIIALDDSEMYSEESAATMLAPGDELEAEPMLADDGLDVGDFGAFDMGLPGMAPGVGMVPGASQGLPESPYTVYQVVSLSLVLFLLLVGGMIGYDLARNLWLPDDQIISGGVLKFILSLVGL